MHRDEGGAELIEFAFVSTILIALVYGIVFFGVTLGAKVTVTQAAADGSRAGIVYSSANYAQGEQAAATQAKSDLGWLGFSNTVCGSVTVGSGQGATGNAAYACMSPCAGSISSCTTPCTASTGSICTAPSPCNISNPYVCPATAAASTVALMIVSAEATCPSNANTCITTDVTYYDTTKPIVPAAPGLSVLSPTNIASSSTIELSSPTP
jgi:hypothetical protein